MRNIFDWNIYLAIMRLPNMSTVLDPLSPLATLSLSSPHRVLVVGCAYGGISAVVNLIDLAQGKPRDMVYPGPDMSGKKSRNGVEITVIDERDGYCKFWIQGYCVFNVLIVNQSIPLEHPSLT